MFLKLDMSISKIQSELDAVIITDIYYFWVTCWAYVDFSFFQHDNMFIGCVVLFLAIIFLRCVCVFMYRCIFCVSILLAVT